MTSEGEVLFVTWTHALRQRGRRIKIDEDGGVVAIISYRVPEESFASCEVKIPRTGPVNARQPKQFRFSMPDWCLRARHYEQVQQFGGPFTLASLPKHEPGCVCCTAISSGAGAAAVDSEFFVCKRCLSVWHVECARNELFASDGAERSGPGNLFDTFLCRPCAVQATVFGKP